MGMFDALCVFRCILRSRRFAKNPNIWEIRSNVNDVVCCHYRCIRDTFAAIVHDGYCFTLTSDTIGSEAGDQVSWNCVLG